MKKQNITLIGMAGVGKSTVGILLAELLSWQFIDVDKVLEKEHAKPLQEFLDEVGDEKFIQVEYLKIKELSSISQAVVAPGGSIIYSPEAMRILRDMSTVLYLEANLKTIEQRIETRTRGIVGLKNRSFQELYSERQELYKQYADFSVNVDDKSPQQVAKEIIALIA